MPPESLPFPHTHGKHRSDSFQSSPLIRCAPPRRPYNYSACSGAPRGEEHLGSQTLATPHPQDAVHSTIISPEKRKPHPPLPSFTSPSAPRAPLKAPGPRLGPRTGTNLCTACTILTALRRTEINYLAENIARVSVSEHQGRWLTRSTSSSRSASTVAHQANQKINHGLLESLRCK